MKATLHLRDPQTGHTQWAGAWRTIKATLFAGHELEVEIRPARRNTEQNALLHVLLTEVASQVEWAGKKRDAETWKRLMTAAWLRARGESIEVLPAIDGHGIDVVFRRTSSLTKAECGELIEFVQAWAAEHGVQTDEAVEQ
jgi:hypothetical protein